MSNIQTLLNKIKTAIYGIDVRDAIHDSIKECYDNVSDAKTRADQSVTNANTAATKANVAAGNAELATEKANLAADKADTATTKANAAASSANTAANDLNEVKTTAQNAAEKATASAGKADKATVDANAAATAANDAATKANAAAQTAQTKATTADTAATRANTASADLETLKDDLVASADKANTNANLAKEKADAAAAVVTGLDDLKNRTNQAAEKANAAATAANNAASAANEARDKANNAATNVAAATSSANLAADKANAAATKADSAANLATEQAELAQINAENVKIQGDLAEAAAGKVNDAVSAANTAATNANAKADLVQERLDQIAGAEDAANAAALTAEEKAASANAAAINANTATADARDAIDEMTEKTAAMETSLLGKVDDGYVENGYLYLTANGEVVVGPLGPFSGGGGGSGEGNNAVITMTNTTGWLAKTVASGSECKVSLIWSSKEDEIATGNGTLFVTVSGSLKLTKNVEQGTVEVELKDYLSPGVNSVRVKMSDVYGNSRSMNFTITAVEASIRSGFDASLPFTGAVTYTYTPTGKVDKTVHFILDGNEIGTSIVTTSGRQQSYSIPVQSHGAHSLRVYYTATIEGEEIRSNELYYDLMWMATGDNTPIVASPFSQTTVKQYETLSIPWTVYTPNSLTSEVTLKANGETVSTQTVSRAQQIWSYRADSDGALKLEIVCGTVTKTLNLTVSKTELDVSAEANDLALYLSSYGRSNNEANPGTWVSGNVSTTFTGFNFTSDGWQRDEDGVTVLRVANDARINIGYKPFAQDFRTTGKTIEIEFATRDVLNYDAVIADWMSGGSGIRITAQKATLKSEQSEIGTQFKENEHVRIAFVVEKRSENRLIYIYINGIMTGATQYPEADDFSQDDPVNITFGSNDCTTDIYCIRVYDNDLTRYQVLDNWIADTQSITDKLDRYERNRVYDEYGQIVIANLPQTLPYLVLRAPSLPTYKGNKLTVAGEYTDLSSEKRSFTFENATADVQGTSSAGYARKNYKIKFSDGFKIAGVDVSGYQLRPNASIATNVFTFKADVASSEGANNVELARLYNDICPYKTPPQQGDGSVRQGIDGFPIVIFHDNGESTAFIGKYNFNNDKGTPEVFGFLSGDESWEIRNNTSDRVLWKSADFAGEDWLNDFEGRHPEDNTDPSNLSAFAAWLVSTDQAAATGNRLETPARYEDVTYTEDTAAYRLAKYKAELANYAEIDSCVFYYLFTELFLMVDSRAKNAFPTKYRSGKWCWLPYDFDTAIGINNEGALTFSYHLEDTDKTDAGADVYNGQQSVMWINLRQAFGSEIKAMYQKLRSDGVLSYDVVEKAYEEHQSKWPEAIWNEDAYYKYLEPLIVDGSGAYLTMLQGSKEEQRKWWLYNRFRYIDAKYNAGDSLTDIITLRGYAKSDITVEPYADIYASIKYGSYLQQTRALRGKTYTIPCPLDNVNDTEIYIYSASQLKSVGDLSGLKVGYAEFSLATRLQSLKLGDASSSYSNGNLTELYLGNNGMLRTLDVRNCPNLGTGEQKTIDLSGCKNIEHIYFDGTAIGSCTLPNGGILKTLHLPATVTNLTIRNQLSITDFTMPTYDNVTTLWLENVSAAVDTKAIFSAVKTGSRVRLIGIDWQMDTVTAANALYDRLDQMRGIDENGNNVEKPQVSGKITVDSLTYAELTALQTRYPDVKVLYNHITCTVRFYSYDGVTLLGTATAVDGGNATYSGTTPTRSATAQYTYAFAGWSLTKNGSVNADALKAVTADRNVYAAYTATIRSYTVTFYNGSTKVGEATVPYGSNATYTGTAPTKTATAQYSYAFSGWSTTNGGAAEGNALTNVTGNRSVYAAFTATVRSYTVSFYNGDTLLSSVTVKYGSNAAYSGSTPTKTATAQYSYSFAGWSTTKDGSTSTSALQNITGNRTVYAAYTATVRSYTVSFYNGSTLITSVSVAYGSNASYSGTTPSKASTAQYNYTFAGWSTTDGGTASATALNNITGNRSVYAAFTAVVRQYAVKFYNGSTLITTVNVDYGSNATYSGSTPTKTATAQYSYSFSGWSLTSGGTADSSALNNITGERSVYAAYTATVRKYTVYFYNGSTLLQTVNNVPYGGSAAYTGDTPVSADGTAEDGYEFTGFVPTGSNITGTTSCYAQYTSPVTVAEITDDWDTIRRNVAADIYRDKYSVGNYKSLDLGDEGTVTMQIVAMNADETEDGSKAPITWVARELLKTSHRMNPSNSNNVEGTGSIGGWEKSEMRTYLNDTIKPLIPEETRKQIKPVKKESQGYDTSGSAIQNSTVDEIWIPSYREIFKSGDPETTGPMYSAVYSDNASRIKMKADATSATYWWLRSASNPYSFRCVRSDGDWNNYYAGNSYGVALGFSTGSDTIKDSWEEILAAMDDGSYKTKYAVGDTKLIDLGSEGVVCVTLVGIDTDDLADGSGKAKMSWITEELLKTTHRMNPNRSGDSTNGYVEGTGSIGGWEKSEMRSYMKETLKPLIPETVRNRIATVTKTQPAYDTTGASVTQTTQDDVWAPSHDELYSSIGLYHSVFPDNASRIKRKSGSTSAALWWLRSAGDTAGFRCVSSNGDWYGSYASGSFGVALGFCLN